LQKVRAMRCVGCVKMGLCCGRTFTRTRRSLASENGHVDIVADYSHVNKWTPMHSKTRTYLGEREGARGSCKLLLASNSVNVVKGNAPLWRASKGGHMEVVELLLARDEVDPRANNSLAVDMALRCGHIHIAELLLCRCVDALT